MQHGSAKLTLQVALTTMLSHCFNFMHASSWYAKQLKVYCNGSTEVRFNDEGSDSLTRRS